MSVGTVLRVCSGTAKGRVLKSPSGMGVRPTSGKVRQAIFSALSHNILGSSVLDLYAGTGAMGIEALSRGAAQVVFLELLPKCLRTIKENLKLTGFSDKATIIRGNVLKILPDLGRQNRKFDVVIADPPYEVTKPVDNSGSLAEKTLKALVESDILRPSSLVILEHPESQVAMEIPCALRLVSLRKYGGTAISVLCPAKGE